MRPEELSLYETLRASKELECIGIRSEEIIINGILPQEVCETGFFKKKYEAEQRVIKETEKEINKPKHHMLLRNNEVKGIDALTDVAVELFNGKKPSFFTKGKVSGHTDPVIEKPDINRIFLPDKGTKSLFLTGKGGVGKTTLSCITALHISEKGYKTLLVTTDPAAHIGEVLNKRVGTGPTMITENLYAVMIDQEEAFEQYKEQVLSDARGKYSEDMLAAMEEELNSPCIEEMAAFEKFAQFMESTEYDVLVFDTAPTGHTLRLLDLPFDYAKQVEMMVAATADSSAVKDISRERFRGIIETLKDKSKITFSIVLYPESTPITEAHRAMLDLQDAGIEAQLVIANMVLPEEVCTNDFFKNRRQMQMRYLKEIKVKFNLPVLIYPLMEDEIKGIERLKTAGLSL
jgi:arsenite-transporting ATPase